MWNTKHTSEAKTRETLLVIVLGLSIMHLIFRHEWMLIAAITIGVLGISSARLANLIHAGWYLIAEKMGRISNTILLSMIYFIVLIPFAMLSQLFRKDMMHIKSNKKFGFVKRDHLYCKKDLENMW